MTFAFLAEFGLSSQDASSWMHGQSIICQHGCYGDFVYLDNDTKKLKLLDSINILVHTFHLAEINEDILCEHWRKIVSNGRSLSVPLRLAL